MTLDRATFPEFRDRILAFESEPVAHEPRSYPGYPRVALGARPRARLLASLDRTLLGRRSARDLAPALPSPDALGRLLGLSHGITGPDGRGPVPSSGALQALELYVVSLATTPPGWLGAGAYHYDRPGHHLSRLREGATREEWAARAPSMRQFAGAALLFVLAGDLARCARKYGPRAERFLLLEAGHLMQDLCLVATSLGLCTLPLGGVFEAEVARALDLPRGDAVLYAGACGAPLVRPGTSG